MKRPPRILVVDDNRDAADMLGWFLARRGCRLAYAYCGLTGLALAKVTKPDLMILNYQMPWMNGLDLLCELRADPKTVGIKVIMTSGWVGLGELAQKAGAQDFAAYPLRIKEFGEKVERVLRS